MGPDPSLAARQEVSCGTILRAYDKLIARGLAHAVRGSGFFVSRPASAEMRPDALPPAMPRDADRLLYPTHTLDHAPGSGVLQHEEAAQSELTRALRSVAAGGVGSTYGDPFGYLPLRQQLREKLLGEGIDTTVDNIVTTPGAVAGITLAIRAFVRPGNWALVEDPSSFIHVSNLMAQGASIARVPRRADGPDLTVLRNLCEQYRPCMFLLSSVLQNPTGTCIAPNKVRQLIELAAEYDMLLVDDNSYADLLPPGALRAAMPLMLLGQTHNVIHVGGFSHTLAASFGTGFVVADDSRIKRMQIFRPNQGLGNMILQERLVYRFLSEGLYRRRCDRIRSNLQSRHTNLSRMCSAAGLLVPPIEQGLFLWASLGTGIDANTVATKMQSLGYLTAPAKYFSRDEGYASYMRFNVTTTDQSAIDALGTCLS